MNKRIFAITATVVAVLLATSVLYGQNRLTTGRALVGDLLLSRGGRAVLLSSNAGAPTSGTSGTGVNVAGPGSFIVDTTNTRLYINTNTQASPTWSMMPSAATAFRFNDNILFTLGTDDDIAFVNRSTALGANTALTGVLVGTPVSAATPANSALVSNVTADGDIAFFTRNAAGANSIEGFRMDASAGLMVFNEAAADWDIRFEGDNNANMIVSDGGTDSLGIGRAVVAGAFAAIDGSTVNRAGVTGVGRELDLPAATYTQTNAATTTLAIGARVALGIPTFAGTNVTQVLTDAATLYIAGTPVAGTNMAITNPWSLWVDAGSARFDGAVSMTSPTAGFGYATGAGGTVTQATSKSTAVTLNTVTGAITMNGAALAADTTVSFTLTNSAIAATDAVIVLHESAGTLGAYSFASTAAAGSASISVHNNTPGSLSEAIVLRFVVIKSVNA